MGMQERSLRAKFKDMFDKWRVLFLIFIVIYASFLVLNLGVMTIQWDEANHLNGGLLLVHGRTQKYMDSAMFYPPLDDLVITAYFSVGGISIFNGRLVAVTFAVLSVWAIFELTNKIYGKKTALVSAIFLATMPGFVWLSRVALLETMLIFFFSAAMLFFFMWLRNPKSWLLTLSGVALGLGFLTKYQVVIAFIVMIASILFLGKDYLKARLSRLPLVILIAGIIALPWIIISYKAYSSGMLNQWLYAMNIGDPDKTIYGARFPIPVFYFVEMVWPYGVVHPVSVLMYAFGLLGLGLLLWRRRPEDKFLLIWFMVVYVFFTLIGNKQWRYVVPLFPVLAISAASLIISAYGRMETTWKNIQVHIDRRRIAKVEAGLLIGVVGFAVAYSCADAYAWVTKDAAYNLPIEAATNYMDTKLNANESLLILCSLNIFGTDMVKFYAHADGPIDYWIGQYPDYPVDTHTPNFNVTELTAICEQRNVKYLMLFEYGEQYLYFNSTLTEQQVHAMLMDSLRFADQASFGSYPSRIFILSFT